MTRDYDDFEEDYFGNGRHDSYSRPRDPRARLREELRTWTDDRYPVISRAQPFPIQGPFWESIKEDNKDIHESDLLALIVLILDFQWCGAVKLNEYTSGKMSDVVLGDRLATGGVWTRRDSNSLPDQWVILFRGAYYHVMLKDWVLTDENDRTMDGDTWVQLGRLPEEIGSKYLGRDRVDQDLREASGYRQIFCFTSASGVFQEPSIGLTEPEIRQEMNTQDQALIDYFARLREDHEAECVYLRARTLLGRAWLFRYLIWFWTGIQVTDEMWSAMIEKVMLIPWPGRYEFTFRGGKATRIWPRQSPPGILSWPEARDRLASRAPRNRQESMDAMSGIPAYAGAEILQVALLLQIAHQLRGGGTFAIELLTDPLNTRTPAFRAALAYFRTLPGFRTWEEIFRLF